MDEMLEHRIALVASTRQHHRVPEIGQLAEVMGPVLDGVIEDRPKVRVLADARVEELHKLRQRLFRDDFTTFRHGSKSKQVLLWACHAPDPVHRLRLARADLSRAAPDRLCTIPEIAGAYRISQNHLTKVAHDLGKAGFVESERGRFGGLRLAKPAATISVGAVVRIMEGEDCLADCDTCVIAPACGLAIALEAARDAFMSRLDAVSLADISRKGGALRRLVHAA